MSREMPTTTSPGEGGRCPIPDGAADALRLGLRTNETDSLSTVQVQAYHLRATFGVLLLL